MDQYQLDFTGQPVETLARWYCTLPGKWPADLPGRPEIWESLPLEVRQEDGSLDLGQWSRWGFVHDFRVTIHQLIGDKEIVRYWYEQVLPRVGNLDFEKWWKDHQGDFQLF